MSRLTLALVASLLVSVDAFAGANCITSGIEPSLLSAWARSVVVVHRTSGTGDQGLGLVVGWDRADTWIATAAHVVYGDLSPHGLPPPQSELPEVAVSFPGEGGTAKPCADNLAPRKPVAAQDLVFLCARPSSSQLFSDGIVARRVATGDELRILGSPGVFVDSADHDSVVGIVERVTGAGGYSVRGLANRGGYSGGPVISARGITGLYLGHDKNGYVLPMGSVREAARLARVPWSLADYPSFDCAYTRTVCVTVTSTSSSQATFRLHRADAQGDFNVVAGACTSVPEGSYELLPEGTEQHCAPLFTTIYAATEPLSLTANCSLGLRGTWQSSFGELVCTDLGVPNATCFGLTGLGLGLFSGDLRTEGTSVAITGRFEVPFGSALEARGRLQFANGRLVGEIGRSDLPPRAIELWR